MTWHVLTLTAEALPHDLLGRPVGAPLYPQRLSIERMAELKRSDPVIWEALYQQQEQDYSGAWFGKENLQFYRSLDISLLNRYIVVDPANSKKKTSDYTAMFVFGVGEDRNYYWIHMIRDRLDPDERARLLIRLHRTYKPLNVGYEQYGMQADIFYIQQLMDKQNYRFAIEPLGAAGDHRRLSKQDRIRTLLPLFRSGQIYLPEHQSLKLADHTEHDMIPLFIEKEYLRYPKVTHDDMLDAMARMTDPQMKIDYPMSEESLLAFQTPSLSGRTWVSG